ncbi:nitrite/sulfite reductase [Paenibacillus sp. 7124]|uniref:Nitrite/sulfite reductase n=1 Tax=Paenibacillus apii TaxID=1850370 RepID=A0A6M1PJ28_9BACL|nr:nitrite/sulfite reductase [Paenibacillus apii]NGM82372.1 nitrite/sulfite reductase [Paenibacillus apii]NJJ39508.1 nitrite/sulfite reductase [Paenibacillus apii]
MAYEPIWTKEPDKLSKFELVKLEKDGLDVIRTIIEKYALEGYDSIPVDDLDLFKWAGVYQQKPKNGHFMMRVRINSGIMTSAQARTLADISRLYGRELVDITTRQAIQFHWLTVENFPDIFKRLDAAGLYSFEACGDCPRTIVGNPLAGIDKDELLDTKALVDEVNSFFMLNRDFSNLPRKLKMSISANPYNNAHAEINDLAFTPAIKEINGEEVIGFHVMVGGGLSAKPHLAQKLDIFVRPEEVLKVATGVATIFRDYGYREKRHHARLKFLMADWGAEKFKDKLVELIGELPARGEDKTIGWQAAYFYGVQPQPQQGLNYVGLNVPVGRLNADELTQLADLADAYGDGHIRTTMSQNAILSGVPDDKVDDLLAAPLLKRLTPAPKPFISRTVACTGNEFCSLALVETKKRAVAIAEFLDERLALEENVRIHIIGCPNACGQKQIADIGLQGALVKTPEGMVEAFDIAIGGTLGGGAQGPAAKFAQPLKGRVKADEVAGVLEQLLLFYKSERTADEGFHAFAERVGLPAFQDKLSSILAAPAS